VPDVALVKNNARVGSVIAVNLTTEMQKHLQNNEPVLSSTRSLEPTTAQTNGEDGYHATGSRGNIVSSHQ